MTKCECGQELDYSVTPFMTTEKRVCPKCGRIKYIEETSIDWARIIKGEIYEKKDATRPIDKAVLCFE